MGRLLGGQAIVDEVLLAKLSAEVAVAAAATLASARTVRLKPDRTPVTDADERSQDILLKAMARLMPGIAVVSEELPIRPSRLGDVFALIDPLDGTKEFIAGRALAGTHSIDQCHTKSRAVRNRGFRFGSLRCIWSRRLIKV